MLTAAAILGARPDGSRGRSRSLRRSGGLGDALDAIGPAQEALEGGRVAVEDGPLAVRRGDPGEEGEQRGAAGPERGGGRVRRGGGGRVDGRAVGDGDVAEAGRGAADLERDGEAVPARPVGLDGGGECAQDEKRVERDAQAGEVDK